MEWSHLELRKASNLRKEVDEALRRFTSALRRAAAAKKKKEARLDVKNKREPYINSALPYVDARRVEAAIYRPASKDGARWNY